jgi:transposase
MKKFDYFIGIDVSKLKLVIAVLFYQNNKTEKLDYQAVDNKEKSILSFLKKYQKDKISAENTLFCFENTGIYSMPLACVLSEQGLDC